jgi:hypothetical protein
MRFRIRISRKKRLLLPPVENKAESVEYKYAEVLTQEEIDMLLTPIDNSKE